MSFAGATLADDEVKIGFLVKQPEEPWFQTEWAFAEKAAKDKGFTLLKIAVPDGENPDAPRAVRWWAGVVYVVDLGDVRLMYRPAD